MKKMKTQSVLIICLFFLCNLLAFGQTSPSVIPPAPVSREFAKYITQEVTLYNGIPEINIPLYTIKLKGLNIPINLSYHASGIKYGQEDGYVGVGWVLNPGYRISRSIYGHADDQVSMPSDFLSTISSLEMQANSDVAKRVDRDQYLSQFVPNKSLGLGSFLDGAFDQFVFSTPSSSGEFIITDRTNKVVTTLEESNLSIDYKTGQTQCTFGSGSLFYGIMGFQITDELGNKYAFGEYNPQSQCLLETTSSGNAVTAWGMSDITTPTGDQVSFAYGRRAAGEFINHMRTYTIAEASGAAITDGIENIYTGNGYYSFFPTQITTPNETITFQYGTGDYVDMISKIDIKSLTGDLIKTINFFYSMSFYGGVHYRFLDYITISGSDLVATEKYSFDYHDRNSTDNYTLDHYGNHLSTYMMPIPYYHQEFLDDPILVPDGSGYQSQTMIQYLPGATSREPNPVVPPDYFSLKRITYPTGGYTDYEFESGKYREVDDTGPVRNAGIRIKSIKSYDANSPVPIVKSYTYGNEESGYGYGQYWINNMEGLFVTESTQMIISLNPKEAAVPRIISYSSTMQGDVGQVFMQSGFVKYPCVTEYNNIDAAEMGDGTQTGKTVYYFKIGNMFGVSPLQYMNTPPNRFYINGTPNYVLLYKAWDKPLLQRKVVYSYDNGLYTPVQEEVFEYVQEESNDYVGLKVEQAATNNYGVITNETYHVGYVAQPDGSGGTIGYDLQRYFNYGTYTISVGKNLLRNKTETQYSNGNAITTNYSYDYSNLLLSKETHSRSTGDNIVTYTTYPRDYSPSTNFIDDMNNNHLLAYPVEQVKYIDDGTNQKIISGKITTYKSGGKGLKDEELFLENSASIPLNTFKFSNRANGLLPPSGTQTSFSAYSQYKSRLRYNTYDTKGNILSTTQDGGLTTSYLWGYSSTYPIAEVKNAAVDQIAHSGFESFDLGGWTYTPDSQSPSGKTGNNGFSGSIVSKDGLPEGNYIISFWAKRNVSNGTVSGSASVSITTDSWQLYTFTLNGITSVSLNLSDVIIDDIRLYPVGAQMKTYTYKPIVGMTSQSDPNGIITYYFYDSNGRLSYITDQNSNIIKRFEYHYENGE
ncbi:MAG: hypothetical protein JST48_09465 [Bacteroidetes bacterium]|nr:hypothetical protein [Bacteroidota bacterium]